MGINLGGNMYREIDGKLVKLENYKHKSISNYPMLPIEKLLSDGWLCRNDVNPPFDEETQYLSFDRYEVEGDTINFIYMVKEIPKPSEEA